MHRLLFRLAVSTLVLSGPVAAQPELYQHGAVAADHPLASDAGAEMLRRGGNAVDAAVAASFCLSVVRPYSCGLGGGGFMVIYVPPRGGAPARAVALNYRETAPAAVGPDYYVKLDDPAASRDGVHAVGVPGTVAGLLHALEEYGTLDRGTVLGPAIVIAEIGWTADASHVTAAARLRERLAGDPALRDLAAPLWRDLCLEGEVAVGSPLRNPDQARALRLIAEDGRDVFYRGPIAAAIVELMQDRGGPIAAGDLAGYEIRVGAPLRGRFRDRELLVMPLPSSGGITMLQILGILDRRLDELRARLAPRNPDYLHLLVEAMKHGFADRARWLADDAFVEVPVQRLLSSDYLDARAAGITAAAGPPGSYGTARAMPDDGGTSHISVLDDDGMAVACTETINLRYGSMVAVPGFGFALNNEMDDFTTRPGEANYFGLRQSEANLPAPGKRPLSSMSPTIVLAGDGRVVIVAGASGGPRIISGTLQCILNCELFAMTPAEAVAAPRVHHQWRPDRLEIEAGLGGRDLDAILQARGHRTDRRENSSAVQLIAASADGVRAASDPRKGGAPAGH